MSLSLFLSFVLVAFFWGAFFLMVRRTHQMGIKCRTLGPFWFSLVCLVIASVILFYAVLSESGAA